MHAASPRSVGVLVTDDAAMRDLNRDFRSVDAPTDVLTFPALPNPAGHLGDLAISLDTARRQAKARGASATHELQFLAIHGTLHLLGFDDEEPDDRAAMVTEMNRVASSLGIPEDREWWSRGYGGVA